MAVNHKSFTYNTLGDQLEINLFPNYAVSSISIKTNITTTWSLYAKIHPDAQYISDENMFEKSGSMIYSPRGTCSAFYLNISALEPGDSLIVDYTYV